MIDNLAAFPFLQEQFLLNGLKTELAAYLAASTGVAPDIDLLQWWKDHQEHLPNWLSAMPKFVLVQPS